MELVAKYQQILEDKIANVSLPSTPANLYDPLRYFLTLGGKRMRPVLTLLGCNLFNVPGLKAINAALAVELFHNFTLIHDDIMDEAPLRRGKETVHTKWDENIGILSGDVLFVIAYQHLSQHDVDVLPRLLEIFSTTAKEVCEGQQMDMDFESRGDVTIPEYIEMIRLKTSVLLGAALEMGATVAKADARDAKLVYDFGMDVGLAFQIQDDILDLYADPDKFGKQIGGDVLADKKTYLLLRAFEKANASQKATLDKAMTETNPEAKVAAVRAIFDELGVRQDAEQLMQDHLEKAKMAMSLIKVEDENKQDLLNLADYLMNRDV